MPQPAELQGQIIVSAYCFWVLFVVVQESGKFQTGCAPVGSLPPKETMLTTRRLKDCGEAWSSPLDFCVVPWKRSTIRMRVSRRDVRSSSGASATPLSLAALAAIL